MLVAEGNPHQQQQCEDGGTHACTTSCPAQALPPHLFLLGPVALGLKRQADTFLRVDSHSHAGVPVNIFHFQQPARLSHLELPFGIALVSGVDERGLMSFAAPPSDAADSWFPDYSWAHVLMCSHGEEGGLHLGCFGQARHRFRPAQRGAFPIGIARGVAPGGEEKEPLFAFPLRAGVGASDSSRAAPPCLEPRRPVCIARRFS